MSDDMLRALIEGERAALVPPSGAQQATWAKVAHSVATAAPPATDPSTVSVAASGTPWSPWAKALVVLALGGTVLAGVVLAGRAPWDGARAPVPAPVVAAATPRESIAPPDEPTPPPRVDRAPAFAPAAEAPRDPETPSAEPRHDPEPPVPAPVRPPVQAPPVQAPPVQAPPVQAPPEPGASVASDLAEEARLLAAARRALGRDAFEAALAALAEHARRFPEGQLTEDRLALQARAHCGGGDAAAGRRVADALRRAFPSSSHLARVGRACAEQEAP